MNADEGKAVLNRANAAITWAAEGDHDRKRANWQDLIHLVKGIVNADKNREEERPMLNKTVPREQYRRQRERSNALENVLEEVRALTGSSAVHDEFCQEGYTEPEPGIDGTHVLPCDCWVSELKSLLNTAPRGLLKYRDRLTTAQALDDFVEIARPGTDWRRTARERADAIREEADFVSADSHKYNCASGTMANVDEFYPCNCGKGES